MARKRKKVKRRAPDPNAPRDKWGKRIKTKEMLGASTVEEMDEQAKARREEGYRIYLEKRREEIAKRKGKEMKLKELDKELKEIIKKEDPLLSALRNEYESIIKSIKDELRKDANTEDPKQ